MTGSCCDRCLRPLEEGELRFEARLSLRGGTGGSVSDTDARQGTSDAIQDLVDEMSALTERELMEGVAEEFRFVLCGACRGRLREDPAGASTVRGPASRVRQ